MFYINQENAKTADKKWTDTENERKKLMEGRLTAELTEILNNSDGKKIYWKGSMTDLMEVVYTAYMSGTIYDDMGQPCSFKHLVHSTCRTMHVQEPVNPRSYVYRAQNRKGIRQEPFIQRYKRMMEGSDSGLPLTDMIKGDEKRSFRR